VQRRIRLLRRVLLAILAVALVVALVLAILLSRGAYGTYPKAEVVGRGAAARELPDWTRWCRSKPPSAGNFACSRVSGRVIWVQKHDPDGDGDRHLIVMARLHPRIVKLAKTFRVEPLPGIGDHVDAVGWVQVGASGHAEIDTIHLKR
jgi:hypothetical protein